MSHTDAFAAGGSIANGENVTGTVTGGQIDEWTFTAAAGTFIEASASEVGPNTAFTPRIDLIGPNGTDLAANGNDIFAHVAIPAPATGTYTIRVQQYYVTGPGGMYSLNLAQSATPFVVPAGDEGGPIGNGQNVTGALVRGDMDLWSFTAAKGTMIEASASEVGTNNTNFVPRLDLFGPDGTDLSANGNDIFAHVALSAPADGTYFLLVQQYYQNDVTGTYSLNLAQSATPFVVPAGDEGGPIGNNQNVTGAVFRGDMDQWSFCASKGQTLEVTATDTGQNTAFVPRIDLFGPDGTDLAANANDVAAQVTLTAPADGTYTILVQQYYQSDLTGNYSLEMVGGSACGPIFSVSSPIRLIDTRTLGSGPIAAGTSRCFTVAGAAGLPSDVAAVVLNVTAVGYGTDGWVTVYPAGQSVPQTSTLNFDVHEYAMANGAIMRIGTGGQVCVNVGTAGNLPGSAQVVLDATGYLTADDLQVLPMLSSPQRLIDTRSSGGPIPTGTSRCFVVTNTMGIPSDAAAIVVNVTAVSYGVQGWLTAYPNGQAVPATSTVNFDTSEYAIGNGAIVRVGSGGQVCVNTGTINAAPGSSNVILDVTGYLTAAGLAQMPMLASPQRLVDTRTTGGPVAAGQSRCFNVAGVVGVPSTASAVVLNMTAVGYQRQGWLTAYPGGQPVPATSTLNFDTTEYAMANGVIVAIGSGGQVCVNVGSVNGVAGQSQIIIDLAGYI
ncbi:MAG: PPC domain-containing protein [Chloroflexi bacterium]|nr:PPC domain-containing protein [Chloroflexota bacterium]